MGGPAKEVEGKPLSEHLQQDKEFKNMQYEQLINAREKNHGSSLCAKLFPCLSCSCTFNWLYHTRTCYGELLFPLLFAYLEINHSILLLLYYLHLIIIVHINNYFGFLIWKFFLQIYVWWFINSFQKCEIFWFFFSVWLQFIILLCLCF